MDKKIILDNTTALVKVGDKNYYRRIVKNVDLEIKDNNVFAVVSDSPEEKRMIGDLIVGNVKPTLGAVELIGDYFNNKKEYRGNKFEFIKKDDLLGLPKDKTIYSYLNENMFDKKFVNTNYKAAYIEVKNEIARLTRQLEIFKSDKKYLQDKLIKKEEFYKERITEVNPELRQEKQTRDQIEMFNALLEENSQQIKRAPRILEKDIELEKKFSLGKEHSLKDSLKEIKSDLKRIKKLERVELREKAKSSDIDRGIDKLILSRSKRESNSLIRYFNSLNKPNFAFVREFNQLILKVQNATTEKKFYEELNELLKETKKISKFVNTDISTSLNQRIDFINNILNPKSPINSKYFNELLTIINRRYDDKKKYFGAVISDIKNKLIQINQQDKQERNSKMREIWEFEMISLRFQEQIYRERIQVINDYKEAIDQVALEHNVDNTSEIYDKVYELEVVLNKIDIALNRWRYKRKVQAIKMRHNVKMDQFYLEEIRLKENIEKLEETLRFKSLYDDYKESYVQEFTNEFKLKIESDTYEITKEEKIQIKSRIEELEEAIEKLSDKESLLISKLDTKDIEAKELEMSYLLDEISFDIDSIETTIDETSLAQRQRLSLVKAVLEGKEVVIIEDPSYDIDLNAKTEIGTAVKNISKNYGIIIILLTDDMRIASTISDTIAFMNYGVVYEQGVTSEVFGNPIHPFTISKIKSMSKGAVITQETTILNYRGETLNHNSFSDLDNRAVNENHSIFCTEIEYNEWVGKE